MSETVTYPGYLSMVGPTIHRRNAPGPFYVVTYTERDEDGYAVRTERFVDTLDEAEQIAKDAAA